MNKEKLENIKNSILEEKLCAVLTNITSDRLLKNPEIAASLKNYRYDKEIATSLEHCHGHINYLIDAHADTFGRRVISTLLYNGKGIAIAELEMIFDADGIIVQKSFYLAKSEMVTVGLIVFLQEKFAEL